MNIAEILSQQAHDRADAPAIIDIRRGKDRITTFAELDKAAARGAALLLAAGMHSGETVLVFQPMSAELYIALIALNRLGMTAMFLDPSAGREHIERCCAIRPPAALIASPKAHLLRLISPALRTIPRQFVFGPFSPGAIPWHRSDLLEPNREIAACGADTPSLITFTSGSTGQPKAVVRSHGFLLEQHRVLKRALHLTAGSVDLTTLPVFVLANLASGVTSLIPDADLRFPGRIEPGPVLRQIARHRPGSTAASPAFLMRICTHCEAAGTTLPGFRHVFTGGAPVFPDHLERFASVFAGANVVAVYGSTEAEPIAHIPFTEVFSADMADMLTGAGLLTGIPVEEIAVRVILPQWGIPLGSMDEARFSVLCRQAGEVGEIVVSGRHVLKGYLNGIGDEETKFRVDDQVWHRTGDSGYFDERGRLWLLGRCTAVITDDRGTLYPFAAECAARRLPGVNLAAVIGRRAKRLLFIQPRKGADIDPGRVTEALSWAMLDEVRLIDEIPLDKRHNAKIDYNRLAGIS